MVVHSPNEKEDKEDANDETTLQRLIKAPSTESSDLASPGEVVVLTFRPPKTPPPVERVDSGRNVNVSVNIADFLKPKAATAKKSSSSSSDEESSSSEEEGKQF